LTARDLFLEIVETNPRNETAWMWLTGLLDDLDDCIYACEQVLDINPQNANVRQYLGQLLAQKEKQREEYRLYMEGQVTHARELVKEKKKDEALELIRLLTKSGEVNADGWLLLAELSTDMDERLPALEKLLALAPGDAKAQKELERLRHFKNNPLDLAEMYAEQGDIEKAIEAYGAASIKSKSKKEQREIYWKTVQLENLRQEKITHVSSVISIARLTAGPPLLYFMLLLAHVGLNPFAEPAVLLWIGFFWVVLGGFLIALASIRSRSRIWSLLFKDAGSGGTPAARFSMAFAGWVLVILPFAVLFFAAFNRM
jgi:tetratricopeptide (TPR) repeat protein